MSEQIRQKAKNLVGSRGSAELVTMLADVDRRCDAAKTVDERSALSVVRVWICDELESRHPEVNDVLDAWVEGTPDGRTYFEVLSKAVMTLLSNNVKQTVNQ